jgi:hypothetical protein
MNQEIRSTDIIWASNQYLLIPFPDWGDDFEEWDADKVITHIDNNKVEVLEDADNREIARLILQTAVNFRESVRIEARDILQKLSDVLNAV